MKARICGEAGCGVLIDSNSAYCEKHKKEKIPFQNAIRSNEGLYNTTQWRNLRKKILKKYPNCSICGEHPNSLNLEVHHITPPRGDEELFFDESNVIPVCPACHKRLTAMEVYIRKFKNWNDKPWPFNPKICA